MNLSWLVPGTLNPRRGGNKSLVNGKKQRVEQEQFSGNGELRRWR